MPIRRLHAVVAKVATIHPKSRALAFVIVVGLAQNLHELPIEMPSSPFSITPNARGSMLFRSFLQLRKSHSSFRVVSICVAVGVAACGDDGASSPSDAADGATADANVDATQTGEAGESG